MSIRFDDLKQDQKTVAEFVRRAEKGLPADRWTDGAEGDKRLAAACKRLLSLVQLQASAMDAMLDDIRARGTDAMEPHVDPCRDD
jgi:hypothetical protein